MNEVAVQVDKKAAILSVFSLQASFQDLMRRKTVQIDGNNMDKQRENLHFFDGLRAMCLIWIITLGTC